MLFLTLAAVAIGGLVMSKMNEERELYAPKPYLAKLTLGRIERLIGSSLRLYFFFLELVRKYLIRYS
jgi:hypothetical protein